MSRPSSTAMIEELDRFEEELRSLALEIVRAVLIEEAARRELSAEPAPAAPRRGRPPGRKAGTAAVGDEAAKEPVTGKRPVWTRELVIEELATWLLSGTVVEASFLSRHGRPGLVSSAKRIFGRFDAALNAANLQLAQRYPEGIPTPKNSAAAGH